MMQLAIDITLKAIKTHIKGNFMISLKLSKSFRKHLYLFSSNLISFLSLFRIQY